MRTPFPFRLAAASIIAAIAIAAAPSAFSQENIYEKIVPRFSTRSDVDMRYLGTEAYESLAGVQLISAQTRSLASECMGDITSVVILNSSSEAASKIGLDEFENFRRKNPQMRLLMRTRSASSERSSWFLPAKGDQAPQLIVIVRDAQVLMIAVMTGEDEEQKEKPVTVRNGSSGEVFEFHPDGTITRRK